MSGSNAYSGGGSAAGASAEAGVDRARRVGHACARRRGARCRATAGCAWTPIEQARRARRSLAAAGARRARSRGRACYFAHAASSRDGGRRRAGRDPEQRLLREPELLRLVPAPEAEAGVPVQVAGVRPVAGQHARHPPPQQPLRPRRGSGAHARAAAPVVEAREVDAHDVRVLGRVDVQLRARRAVRAGSGSACPGRALPACPARGRATPRDEARELAAASRVQAATGRRSQSRRPRRPRAYQLIWFSRSVG